VYVTGVLNILARVKSGCLAPFFTPFLELLPYFQKWRLGVGGQFLTPSSEPLPGQNMIYRGKTMVLLTSMGAKNNCHGGKKKLPRGRSPSFLPHPKFSPGVKLWGFPVDVHLQAGNNWLLPVWSSLIEHTSTAVMIDEDVPMLLLKRKLVGFLYVAPYSLNWPILFILAATLFK
jgi:hypothetical protein